ncbi:MAG TPA: LptA/OstA family protein [Magnetospirillum sp.]|nr:LptA/OstA family protein [Magnetospirillum sp.]
MMRPTALALAVAALLAASPAAAQGFNLSRDNDSQIQVYADDGIEWISEANRVVARGNAKAVRGAVTVTADSLTAYYRQGPGGNEIWRLDADGSVTIATPTETATGTKATYDLDKAIFVLRGQPAKLVTPTDTVTAKDALEYWENERMAVARGDGYASNGEKSIRADVLTARFKDKGGAPPAGRKGAAKGQAPDRGSLELQRADAYGHVLLTTARERVSGDRGDYNLETGIATVSGSVKLTRDGNELNGGFAHVNLNTGISKLFGAAPGEKGGDTRAHGTFIPDKQEGEKRRAIFQGAGPSSNGAAEKR